MTARADKAWKHARLERPTLHEARHCYASYMIAAWNQYLRLPLGESNDQPSGLMTLWVVLIALSSLARYEPAGWTTALAPQSPLAVPIEQTLKRVTLRIPGIVRDALG